ncbi:hypothetical protein ABT072_47835 [Streptomyces sp. NPDC002589]|uniref:hypothetical protein n=1 Tax=Streptomyces sp. NPDC002589 TaxID=3154420 RepID=UPI00331E60C6
MIQPASLTIGFCLGVLSMMIRALVLRVWPRRRPLPLSVATASPELVSALSGAVAERYPDPGLFAYATGSVFERNSPANTAHLYPDQGPHVGAILLDPSDPSSPGGRTAQLLAEMNLPSGVMVIPLGSR